MKNLIIILVLVFLFPTFVIAQEQDKLQGYADGERDATYETSGTTWLLVGCLTGGFSWIYPEIATPSVPQSRLVGKSEAYIAAYTDSYTAKRKSIIQKNSCIGGIIYWGCFAVSYVIIISVGVSEPTTY